MNPAGPAADCFPEALQPFVIWSILGGSIVFISMNDLKILLFQIKCFYVLILTYPFNLYIRR